VVVVVVKLVTVHEPHRFKVIGIRISMHPDRQKAPVARHEGRVVATSAHSNHLVTEERLDQ
jgi:hypothetical protein